MKKDSQVALGLTVASLLLLIQQVRMPVLEMVSNPIAVLLLAGVILTAWMQGYVLVALVCLAAGLYLARMSSTMTSRERRIYLEKREDEARFGSSSVDIQVATHSLAHEPPKMLDTTEPTKPLLVYPPTDETLRSMNGI